MNSKQNAKVIRAELRDALRGLVDVVSVTIGSGTAHHWVHVDVTLPWQDRENNILSYREKLAQCRIVVDRIIAKLKAEKRIELSTFSSDDGFGDDHDCLQITIR